MYKRNTNNDPGTKCEGYSCTSHDALATSRLRLMASAVVNNINTVAESMSLHHIHVAARFLCTRYVASETLLSNSPEHQRRSIDHNPLKSKGILHRYTQFSIIRRGIEAGTIGEKTYHP